MTTEVLIFRSPAVAYFYDIVRVTYDDLSNVVSKDRLIIGLSFEDASARLESGKF